MNHINIRVIQKQVSTDRTISNIVERLGQKTDQNRFIQDQVVRSGPELQKFENSRTGSNQDQEISGRFGP